MTDPIHLNVQLDPIPDRALTVEQAVAATMNALCHALLPAEGQDRVADLAVTADPPAEPGVHWRTGRTVGRTLYQHHGDSDHDGELVGLMDTPELARQVAAAVNAQTPAQSAECHTDGAAAGDGPTASPDDQLRARMAELESERDALRATCRQLCEWTAEARRGYAKVGEERDQARAELETARHVIRTNPQMRLSWVPADQLDAARAEAHAVGYEAGWRDGAASKRET